MVVNTKYSLYTCMNSDFIFEYVDLNSADNIYNDVFVFF